MEDENNVGCSHYNRGCKLLCHVCNEYFWCRHCHNEKYEYLLDPKKAHRFDRSKVDKIKCGECDKVQGISNQCEGCEVKFGKYYCEVCRFYDNEDKGQFHCEGCGICRVGGQENYFHCEKCVACLPLSIKGNHKCISETLKINCPICLEYLMDSTDTSVRLKCGHSIHTECQRKLLQSGETKCPLCKESMVQMDDKWIQLDYYISQTQMPEIYCDWSVKILCSDCHNESENEFHILGIKCKSCGGYNTRRIGNEVCPESIIFEQDETAS